MRLNPRGATGWALASRLKERRKMVERSEYNGKPIIVIKRNENDKFPFSFGVSKARLILENLEEIKKFVQENEAK
jgi:hypothetical protein